jgi:hypothetical protein
MYVRIFLIISFKKVAQYTKGDYREFTNKHPTPTFQNAITMA